MRYLTINKHDYYTFRARVPLSLESFFNTKELIKSLGTKDYNTAKAKVVELVDELQKLIQLKKLNMVDDASIAKLVEKYIKERLDRDSEARLHQISFQKIKVKPKLKDPLKVDRILTEYKNDLSDFDVSRVKTLSESFAEELEEVFDITTTNHKKLALALLRANVKIFETILSRNKGNWGYDDISVAHNPKKELPTIEESFDAFIAKYRGITNARAEQIRDTVNFYKQVAQPLFYFLIDSLDELDDEVMAEMRRTIPFLIKRVGKHQRADIAEFLESGQHKNEKYTRISRATVNKYIKWIKSYLEYLKDKSYTSEDFSESLNTYPSESALMQREHLEKEEINTLINKAKEYDEDIEILVKIHAYSGMRLSEVFKCKLEEKEIEGVGNIKYFDLSDTSLQLKTMPSHRKIPLHNELLSILTKNKFEEIQIKYSSNPDFVSKKINQLINQHISKDKTKVLYSLRHSFATYLKEAMVVESLTAELMGHSRGKTMSYGRYAGSYSLEIMRDTINKLDYSIGGS